MPKRGKKYTAVRAKVDSTRKYQLDEGIALLKELNFAKFDEAVDVAIRLGVNPKHSDQMVRGAVLLPNGTGKTVRVLVFAKGDKEAEARDAGADFVGGDDLADKIKEGWFEFDKVVAAPDMMGVVGKIGKILGPRGLMPNPKVGTVTAEVGRAVSELKKGRVEFRVEKAGIVHCTIGRKSFTTEAIKENFLELLSILMKLKPSSTKGTYLKGVALSTTMGPGVRLEVSALADTMR